MNTLMRNRLHNSPVRYMNEIFKSPFFGVLDQDDRTTGIPAANILENESSYQIQVAAPGLKKSDFKIDLNDKTLEISAQVEEGGENTTEKFTHKEFSFRSFRRSFTLPEGKVKTEGIEAAYSDGILSVTLPKAEPVTEIKRLIEVK